ncbi:MAG TPA: cysteine desulfurase family protein [Polyangia bacterium]|jgi:cysteine desulfurase
MSRVYLDHNATTPLLPAARAAMIAAMDELGNPSSLHAEGRRVREIVERARDEVARAVGGRREEIVFTSGGTEANNLGLRLGARAVVSAVEHPSIAGGERVRVDGAGRVDFDALAATAATGDVVSVQLANHEIGVVQDLPAVVAVARRTGARVHTDAVQALGKIAVDAHALGVDALSVSAHKIGGPKGVGALWLRDGLDVAPIVRGGHQERERRAGTENVVGIAGFGAACAAIARDEGERLSALRDRFERGARSLGARVAAADAPRVPTTSYVAFDGVAGELLMQALDLDGIAVSTGAACSSGSLEPSPVLRAIGFPEGIRVSLGAGNSADDIDRLLACLPMLLDRIRRA